VYRRTWAECFESSGQPVVDRYFDRSGNVTGVSVGVTDTNADEATANSRPCDILTSARPDGSTLTQYYPFDSLILNTPGDEDYDASLPIGILVRNAPAL
jgi:hypothetical protein